MPFMHLVLVKLHIWALQLTHRDIMVAGRPQSTPLSVYIFHSAHKLLLWDVSLSYFLSLVVLFLPLVFTVHHCLSQMVIFRRGKHLGDTVGLFLVAWVQQQSLIAPLMLNRNWTSGRNSHKLIAHLAGKEGGTWRPSGWHQWLLFLHTETMYFHCPNQDSAVAFTVSLFYRFKWRKSKVRAKWVEVQGI